MADDSPLEVAATAERASGASLSPRTTTPRRAHLRRLLGEPGAAVATAVALGAIRAGSEATVPLEARPPDAVETARARKRRLRDWHRTATCWPDANAGLGVHRFPAGAAPSDRCDCGQRRLAPSTHRPIRRTTVEEAADA